VFARLLRGLAAARLSKPSPKDGFRDASRDGFAVRCSYKADDGYLYPLTGAFFFVHKPPLQLPYEDVEGVEFARQQAGGAGPLAGAARTFDLVVRMRGGQEHQFRGIQRTEWQGLFDWTKQRGIHIENVDAARRGPGGAGGAAVGAFALGDDEDGDLGGGGAGGAGGEESSEDSDFEGGSSDEDSSSDGGEGEGSDASEGGSGGGGGGGGGSSAEMVDEEGVKAKKSKKPKKAATASPGAGKGKKKKRRAGGDDSGGGGGSEGGSDGGSPAAAAAAAPAGKKKRAKKDPGAPKKALSAFMYFSGAKREEVKAANPGIAFTEIGRALGEKWREAGPEDRKPFEEAAERDKGRYAAEMRAWKAGGSAGGAAAAAASGGTAGGGGGASADEGAAAAGGGAAKASDDE